MSEVKDTLIKARALVEKGWHQGWFTKREGDRVCYCAVGAIYAVNQLNVCGFNACVEALGAAIHPGYGEMSVAEFNDAHGRTQAEVLALFDRAIEATQ